MRVVTLNVNGIRSAAKKGVYRWLGAQKADVVCLQELKTPDARFPAAALEKGGLPDPGSIRTEEFINAFHYRDPEPAAGVPVGLGCDGSSSADSASMWLESRQAMLLAKLRDGADAGTARMALEMATIAKKKIKGINYG